MGNYIHYLTKQGTSKQEPSIASQRASGYYDVAHLSRLTAPPYAALSRFTDARTRMVERHMPHSQ